MYSVPILGWYPRFIVIDTGHKGLMPCVMSRVKISRLHSFLHAKPSFTTQAYPAQNSKAARISISRSGSQTSSISSNRWSMLASP
jgi:hypothetical protein